MTVTSPRSWVALIGVGALLAAVLAWGWYGRLPRKVNGDGILIRGEHLFKIQSGGAGQLLSIPISPGNVVTQNQVVATMERSQLIEQIANAKLQLEELKKQHAELTAFETKELVRELEILASKRANLTQAIRDGLEQLAWFREEMTNEERLASQSQGSKLTVLATRQNYHTAQQELERARTDLKETDHREIQVTNQKSQSQQQRQLKINEVERGLEQLKTDLARTTQIISPRNGRVLEVLAKRGDFLEPGATILNLEPTGRDLEAVLYLSAEEGKQVSPGMRVQIMPASYRKEEHGYMLGAVRYVADYPATKQAMMSVLENAQLVDKLSGGGAPITVYATLIRDPQTKSGFRWSSSSGPPSQIHSGTLCVGDIVVSEQPPLTLVLPGLRRLFGF